MVFDRRGFVRLKGEHNNPPSASQGDIRQTMAAAQKCARVCGPATRQLVKATAADPAHWNAFLIKNLIGPKRSLFLDSVQRYQEDAAVDRPDWEAAAAEAGLRPISLEYASEDEITPGAQLFLLASTLFSLGLYESVGQPNGNAPAWKESIVS
jgi:hypothetical protein